MVGICSWKSLKEPIQHGENSQDFTRENTAIEWRIFMGETW